MRIGHCKAVGCKVTNTLCKTVGAVNTDGAMIVTGGQ